MGRKVQPAPTRDPVTVLLVGLVCLGLWTPPFPQAGAVDFAAVVLGAAGVVAAAVIATTRTARQSISRLSAAWGAFLGWGLLSALMSGRVWASLVGEVTNLLGWFTLAALTALVAAVAMRGPAAKRALELVAPGVVVVQLLSVLVQTLARIEIRGTLPNSSYLGEALVVLLPLVLLGGSERSRREGALRIGIFALGTLVLGALAVRAALVIVTACLIWWFVRRASIPSTARVLVVLGIIAAALGAGFLFRGGEMLATVTSSVLGGRQHMWSVAAGAVAQRPLLGYGPDGFVAGGVRVTTPEVAKAGDALVFRPGAVDPHGLHAWVAVSTGVVGLGLFVWALVEYALALRRRARDGVDIAPYAWAVAGGLIMFGLQPTTLQVVPLFAFVLGSALVGAGDGDGPARFPVRLPAKAARWVAVGAATVLGVAALALSANASTRMLLEEHGPEVSPVRASAAQAATDFWRLDPHLAHLASLHWGWAATVDPAVAAARPDLAAVERAFAVDLRDPFVALERARTLRYYGEPPETIQAAFADTLDRWSLFPVARAEFARFLAEQGRYKEAREHIAVAELVEDGDPERLSALESARELIESGER